MAGRSTGYTARGLATPRPGALSGRSRSLLARAFARNSALRHMDWLLVLVVAALSALGVLLVWSATQPSLIAAGQDPRTYLKKQLLWVVIGLVLMFVVSLADSRQLKAWTPFFYAASVLALLAVLTPLGSDVNGAKAWISLPGGFQVEPSEFAKVALIVMTAMIFSGARGGRPGLRAVLLALAGAAPLIGLVVIEPALGVALVLIVVTATMILLSGVRLRLIAALAGIVAVVIAAAGGRLGWHVRPGPVSRSAGGVQLRPLAADGLHLHRGRRGTRLRRHHRDRLPARRGHRPRAADRHPGRWPVRPAGRVRHRDVVHVPVVRQHRHDHRHHAHHRHPAAVRLLRRLGRLRRHDRHRPAPVRPPPPQRLRLTGCSVSWRFRHCPFG